MIRKWWVFHIFWCGYRKVLDFVCFLLLETKVSTIQCRGSQASLLDQVQDGEEKAVQNGEALHNN